MYITLQIICWCIARLYTGSSHPAMYLANRIERIPFSSVSLGLKPFFLFVNQDESLNK